MTVYKFILIILCTALMVIFCNQRGFTANYTPAISDFDPRNSYLQILPNHRARVCIRLDSPQIDNVGYRMYLVPPDTGNVRFTLGSQTTSLGVRAYKLNPYQNVDRRQSGHLRLVHRGQPVCGEFINLSRFFSAAQLTSGRTVRATYGWRWEDPDVHPQQSNRCLDEPCFSIFQGEITVIGTIP